MYGDCTRNETLKDLNSKTKINTLSIAVAKADTEPEQELLNQLKGYKSYKLTKNVVEIEPQTITVGPPGSNTKGSGLEEEMVVVETLVLVEVMVETVSSTLVPMMISFSP